MTALLRWQLQNSAALLDQVERKLAEGDVTSDAYATLTARRDGLLRRVGELQGKLARAGLDKKAVRA